MSPSVEPFKEARYKALMDGLECNEILLSEIKSDNNWFRLDSHFYKKKYLFLKKTLSDMPHWFLKDIVSKPIQTGHTPSMKIEEFYNGHIAFIKTDNLHANQISDSFSDYLTDKGNATIARTSLKESDIITTIIGATEEIIARSALVTSECLPANINQNIAQIRVKKNIIFPEYVNAYLNSKYGRNYLHYLSRQTEQVNLNCQEMGLVLVPNFSKNLQCKIKVCVTRANELHQQAKKSYKKAEIVLQNSFKIGQTNSSNISIKNKSESLLNSGRLDAEYYQTKYTKYTDALKTTDTVHTICNLSEKNFIPDENVEYEYIELANVGNSGNISNVERFLGKDLPSRARRQVKTGQVIVASVEGSLQSCALITEEYNNALCSTGFYVLESSVLNPESLLVLFKSEPIQALLKQRCSGTILTAITKDELLAMPLPQIDLTLQREIAIKVQESFVQRRKSELLLEYAQRAVEMAIEQGEETAIKWLKEKGVEC